MPAQLLAKRGSTVEGLMAETVGTEPHVRTDCSEASLPGGRAQSNSMSIQGGTVDFHLLAQRRAQSHAQRSNVDETDHMEVLIWFRS